MPKMPKPISDRTWQGQQSWNREIIENVGDKKVRLTIKVDAYDFQSWGRAELWNGAEWHTIHRIPGQKLNTRVSYVQHMVPPSKFDADVAELRRVAKAVIL